MNITVTQEDDVTVLESEDKKHTALTVLKRYLWKKGADAGYDRGHPYKGGSRLVFDDEDPSDVIASALEEARDDIRSFKDMI